MNEDGGPRRIPFRAMIPNAITALALCLGLTGVRFAFSASNGAEQDWQLALACVVGAGILDGMDGRIARLLRAESRFGAELNSLSDNIAFGTAPALILFLWSLRDAPKFGWTAALALAVCCALRLARFNARLDAGEQPHKAAGFNTGVPAPAGAGLAFVPIFLWLVTGSEWFQAWFVVMPWTSVHRRADDLQSADLQLVVDQDPARVAVADAGGRRSSWSGLAYRDLVHASRDRASLPADDSVCLCRLRSR